jgi:hypothetical protein
VRRLAELLEVRMARLSESRYCSPEDRTQTAGLGASAVDAYRQKQTSRHVRVMSVIILKADIHQRGLHVRPSSDSRDGKGGDLLCIVALAPRLAS